MYGSARTVFEETLRDIDAQGLTKSERILCSPQGSEIRTKEVKTPVLNFCANNYLGLANHPRLVAAAQKALSEFGYGLSSVRFICGTQSLHKELERALADFLGTDDTILYSSCFDANAGLFETLLGEEDAILSDSLNHASIIDGVRLCKAARFRYPNGDLETLEKQLQEAQRHRIRLIATDGVFSMDGLTAKLNGICDLAERYDALVMVDDSHATGFVGPGGRGTPALHGVADRVDIVTSTLGKALGGASGGFCTGRQAIIDLLRQRSRPYLFSNTLAPPIAAASLEALKLIQGSDDLRAALYDNTTRFRAQMVDRGFEIVESDHPIVAVMIGDAALATRMADALLQEGVYVIGFSYPVVPKGKARIRVQLSAAHTTAQVDAAVAAFAAVGAQLGVISS